MKRVPLPTRLYPPIVKDHFSSRRGMSDRTIQDIAAEIKAEDKGARKP